MVMGERALRFLSNKKNAQRVQTCEVERKAKVYMFLRDDQSQQHYSHGELIEFLWRKRPDETGKWCQGTFLRRCVGSGQQVKIRYQDQQKDCETTVNVKDVRPEESQRKKPAMCLMTRESKVSGRGGLAVAEKLLKAGLRDALGKASTGQGPKKGGCIITYKFQGFNIIPEKWMVERRSFPFKGRYPFLGDPCEKKPPAT